MSSIQSFSDVGDRRGSYNKSGKTISRLVTGENGVIYINDGGKLLKLDFDESDVKWTKNMHIGDLTYLAVDNNENVYSLSYDTLAKILDGIKLKG